jgi:hypothetical protein
MSEVRSIYELRTHAHTCVRTRDTEPHRSLTPATSFPGPPGVQVENIEDIKPKTKGSQPYVRRSSMRTCTPSLSPTPPGLATISLEYGS